MGSQDNRKAKKSIDRISNTIGGDGRKFVGELKKALLDYFNEVGDIVKDVVTDIGEGSAEQITDLSLLEVHVTSKSGAPQNNIQVDFSNVNVTKYKEAQVWMKTGSTDFVQVGVTSGLRYIVEDVKADTTYTIKVIAVNKSGDTANFDEAPQRNITIQGSVLIPDAPSQFYLAWDIDGALWEWLYEDNGYVDFFELRLDENAGSYDDKLLDRTRNTYSRVAPPSRSGTAYLFVRNIFGTYSVPAVHLFNKPMPTKPNVPTLESTLDGVVITMDGLPSGYQGWRLVINGEEFKSYNRQFTYYQFSGEITVKYCFFDIIGNSEWSDEANLKIKTVIDKDELPEISYEDVDQSIKDAINAANGQADINAQIKADVEDAKTEIKENIKTDIADIKKEIAEINSDIDASIKEATDGLNQSISEVQGNIDVVVANLNKDAVDSPFTSIKQNNESITTLAAEVSVVDGKTQTNASQITLTNERIDSLVLQVQEVDGKTQTNASNITQTAERLESLVYEQAETLDGKISSNTTLIQQTADSIETTVTEKVAVAKTEVKGEIIDELGDDIKTEVEKEVGSQVSQKADEITATVYEQVKGDVATEVAAQVKVEADAIKSTVYTKAEVESYLADKANKSDVYTKEETTSQISQTADEIKSSVYTKSEVDGFLSDKADTDNVYTKVETATQITQSANEIKAFVNSNVETLDGKVTENTATIKQNTEGITAAVTRIGTVEDEVEQNTASIKLANDSITSVVGKLNGEAEDSGYTALTGLASSIVQTNDSITSVVIELNKSPEECKYSSITQLQDGIDLCVKDKDLSGEEIVSRINLSDGVVTIDGKWVHITGDTVFDENVIVGGNIAADSITADHLKMNAVTSAKIAANAITADKINAGAITTEKITDRSVTSVKIEDGAITATKIVDGAVSSTKIEGGAITTEHIQAGSIIGEHISAGAVTTEKIAAGAITAQQLAAGAITAETLGVSSLSAISAVIGELKTADSGARMVIKDNLIEIYDSNDMLRVRMGVWG